MYNTKYIEGLKIISNDYFQTKSTAYAITSNLKTAEVIEWRKAYYSPTKKRRREAYWTLKQLQHRLGTDHYDIVVSG